MLGKNKKLATFSKICKVVTLSIGALQPNFWLYICLKLPTNTWEYPRTNFAFKGLNGIPKQFSDVGSLENKTKPWYRAIFDDLIGYKLSENWQTAHLSIIFFEVWKQYNIFLEPANCKFLLYKFWQMRDKWTTHYQKHERLRLRNHLKLHVKII